MFVLHRAISNPLRTRGLLFNQSSLFVRHAVKQPTQSRSFTSTSNLCSRRPYPHRPYSNADFRQPILGFLDRIPKDVVFWGIICINGVVFVMWSLSAQRMKQEGNPKSYKWMIDNFTDSWRNLSEGRVWTPLTSTFSHEGVGHILFNGFTFFFMARPVLSMLGSRRFLFLYLGGGLFSCLTSLVWNTGIKQNKDYASYGASGAIYSVVSFLACVAPKMTFLLYGIIPIPAWLAVGGIFAFDTYSTVHDVALRKGTNTAGHVGGLLAGMGYFLTRRFRIF